MIISLSYDASFNSFPFFLFRIDLFDSNISKSIPDSFNLVLHRIFTILCILFLNASFNLLIQVSYYYFLLILSFYLLNFSIQQAINFLILVAISSLYSILFIITCNLLHIRLVLTFTHPAYLDIFFINPAINSYYIFTIPRVT